MIYLLLLLLIIILICAGSEIDRLTDQLDEAEDDDLNFEHSNHRDYTDYMKN